MIGIAAEPVCGIVLIGFPPVHDAVKNAAVSRGDALRDRMAVDWTIDNAGGVAFADGHSEIHKWSASVTRYPVRVTDFSRQSVALTDADFRWVLERTSVPR